jgi:maltose alpha-D-glucosyltransferase / alpha-amylase
MAVPAAELLEITPATWYRDAVIYELHVRAFFDSDSDGVGDFRGLTDKLDYLQELGATALWLLPFYPSPLRDDGYDISDYKGINPAYGTLRDFRTFLREAHRRDLRVITELVLNHTSDQHPWFQRARRARPGSPRRDFYVWSDKPNRYPDARVIFKDFELSNWAYDRVAGAYYWHRFYSHQPDLNFDNPVVRKAMFDVVDFWLGQGVDGLRLDAVPYLFEREGTNCENLPETFDFLRQLRAHVDDHFEDRMLLAEANQWPEDAVAYFGKGDICHMAFHFPLMPRMFMAARQEDRFPVVDMLQETPPIPDSCQWALFLRNHDELTLEMVTDEERDYMYRVYAEDPQARVNLGIRQRLAPLLRNDRKLIEMMTGLLFSLPGTPVIYYGDEIGMGDNIYLGDRDAVRTPMQWRGDRNAGFSQANPQRLYLPVITDPEYPAEALNVEAQQANPNSLLWWTKRLIALRKGHRPFGRGSLEMLLPDNRKVLAFLRRYEEERILVVVNLSRFAQYVELDLSGYRGTVPVELFGNTEFPPIGELPYLVTLAPHSFYWFSLEPPPVDVTDAPGPRLTVSGSWDRLLRGPARHRLEDVLPAYLRPRRWFGSKTRRIKGTEVTEALSIPASTPDQAPVAYLCLVRVEFADGDPETYALPLAFATGDQADDLRARLPQAVVAELVAGGEQGVLFDAVQDPRFSRALLSAVARRRRLAGTRGRVSGAPARAQRHLQAVAQDEAEPTVLSGEQSNSSIAFGNELVLKLFRRLDAGVNPDLEMGRFLTERASFPHVPPTEGSLTYEPTGPGGPITLAVVQGFVPNEGDAWSAMLDSLLHNLEEAFARHGPDEPPLPSSASLLDLAESEPPELAYSIAGGHLEQARLLGTRTAELHLALASDHRHADFSPEPLTALDRRAMFHTARVLTTRTMRTVRGRARSVPNVAAVVEREAEIVGRLRTITETEIRATRIRCHGDLHLGQVLWTGKDFVIIDFEGEPALSLSQRRLKRPALVDVAGMIRSFHYLSRTASRQVQEVTSQGDPSTFEPWASLWYRWVTAVFLHSYLETAGSASFVPAERDQLEALLEVLLLEKAVYELGYEANHRPDWVEVPAAGILELLESGA